MAKYFVLAFILLLGIGCFIIFFDKKEKAEVSEDKNIKITKDYEIQTKSKLIFNENKNMNKKIDSINEKYRNLKNEIESLE